MNRQPPLHIVPDNDTGPEVVEKGVRQKIGATFVPRNWQLSLPFEEVPIGPTIVLVAMEAMTGAVLRNLLVARRPDSVVDLRELIRFDLPGTSREDIFQCFTIIHTHYARDPLPWHKLEARDLALKAAPVSQVLMHEVTERSAKCVMVFVYRREESKLLAPHLTRVMGERIPGPWRIEEAV